MCPSTGTSWNLLCPACFTRGWCQSQTNLEFIYCQGPQWLLDFRKEYICSDLCSPFLIFSIIHALRGTHFSLEYCGLEPKAEAILPSSAPSIHPKARALTGLRPVHVPDQAPFYVWCEPILPFTLVRKLDCEWLKVCIPQYHLVSYL